MLRNLLFQYISFLVAYRYIKGNICTQQKGKYIPSLLVTSEICHNIIHLNSIRYQILHATVFPRRGHALHIVYHSKVKSDWHSLYGVSYQWYIA